MRPGHVYLNINNLSDLVQEAYQTMPALESLIRPDNEG